MSFNLTGPDFQETMPRERAVELFDAAKDVEIQEANFDIKMMALIGKRERLNRNFGFVSLVAFSTTLLASWESLAATYQSGLVNGGPASLLYGLIFSFVGSLATCASLAELSSMYPTAGGQYHWTARLAPEGIAIISSWIAGWVTVLARLAVSASAAYVAAAMIRGLIIHNVDSYDPKEWHGMLLYWAVYIVAAAVNIVGIRAFPRIETLAFVFHICSFFVVIVSMVYLSPRSKASFVFADLENSGGWSSNGLSWCLGLLTSSWSFVGIDATSHMCEEVRNAAVVVPRSMITAMFISGVLTIAFSVALLFSIGDLESTLTAPSGFPIIQVLYVATQSKGLSTIMCSALVLTLIFATFGTLASASRLTWAFARDNGFPFPKYFAHVSKYYFIPVRAILLITIASMLLGLINLGSLVAFNALTTLALIGHYTSYIIPIGLLVYQRLRHKPLKFGPFTLGRWGILTNAVAVIYSGFLFAIMVLPPYQPVTASNMNYAGVIFGGILVICGILWFAYGKRVYKGPVWETQVDHSLWNDRSRIASKAKGSSKQGHGIGHPD